MARKKKEDKVIVEEIKVAEIKEELNDNKKDLVKVKSKKDRKIIDKSKKEIFISFLNVSALVMVICVLAFLVIASISHTAHFWNAAVNMYHEGLHYEVDNIWQNILCVFGLVFLISIISFIFSKINEKVSKIILITLSLGFILLAGIWWVNFVRAPVKSDQGTVFNLANSFSKDNYEQAKGQGYYYMHPLQFGCVLGMEFIIRLIDNGEAITFQMINSGFITAIVALIYYLTKKIYGDIKVSQNVYLLSGALLVLPLYSVVVYGNIFGLFFSLVAVCFLFKFYEHYKVRYIFLMTISMMIAIMFKSNYEIVLIAILISLFIELIKKFKVKVLVAMIALIIGFSATYPIIYTIVEKRSGIEVNEGIPMITYIAMAMLKPYSRNSGWYHDSINVETIYPGNNFDEEKTIEASKEIIINRLKEFYHAPKMMIKFYQDKICSTWIEPAFQTLWWSEPLEVFDGQPEEYKEYILNNELLIGILHGEEHKALIRFLDIMQITIFTMSMISVIASFKNKTYDNKNFILLITFLGGFLFHILWETKSIYVVPFYIMLLPSAADGIENTNIFIKNITSKLFLKIKTKINEKTTKSA